jgi:hypothetical protein
MPSTKPSKPAKPSGPTGPTSAPVICPPGSKTECSSYPAQLRGVGRCVAGTRACNDTGTAFGPCEGEVAPAREDCANQIDDDCDGAVDENKDSDGDGFFECDNDCCDSPGVCSGTPKLVNPGAFEVVGNQVDDDCNPATSDTTAPLCDPAPLNPSANAKELARAFDICGDATEGGRTPGLISATLVAADGKTITLPKTQYGVLTGYGSNVVPLASATMAALSSGTARDESDTGYGGTMVNCGTTSDLPPAYSAAHGGTLQTTEDCASSQDLYDSANLKLRLRVPTNAKGLAFKFKFYSAEWPEFVCSIWNDFFMVLLTSGASGLPADHNISFDALKNPVSVNNAFFEVCDPAAQHGACPAGTTDLAGTGIAGPALDDGGGTRWLETTAPVVPGEIITLELMIWDTGDPNYDSLVLLDSFRWLTTAAGVGTKPD